MTALLEDRVAAFVADHPGYTAREIARELRTREQTVREILHSGPFSHNNGPGQSKCWRIGVEAVGAAPTRPQTHKAKVLQLLSDGKAHSYREGYRLGVMLHSRVADLRRDGYDIRCDKADGNYFYTLVGTLDDGGVVPQRPPSSSVPPDPPGLTAGVAPLRGGLSGSLPVEPGAQAAAEQLVLVAPEFRKAHAA